MRIILFGTGKGLTEMQQKNLLCSHTIISVLDNDLQKQGNTIICNGRAVTIVAPDKVNVYVCDAILITMQKYEYQCEAGEQLESLGVSKEKIYILHGGRMVLRVPRILAPTQEKERPIFFDVSTISRYDWGTGIPRVVNNIYRKLHQTPDVQICPVRHFQGDFITSRLYQTQFDDEPFDNTEYAVAFDAQDRLLCMDILGTAAEIEPYLQKVSSSGCHIYAMIYDILALKRPTWFEDDSRQRFETWYGFLLQYAEGILCSANAVADDVADYFFTSGIRRDTPLKLFCFHLGFEMSEADGIVRDSMQQFVRRRNTFLMVGTVEIRKNHLFVARVFRDILRHHPEADIQLMIIGRNGWKNQDFIRLLSDDIILQDRVLWIQDATDAELQWAYRHTEALIFASMGEGFGLPIVEAAYFGLPLLLSDIPVFREVAGSNAAYFRVNDEAALQDAILLHLAAETHPDSKNIRLYPWKECAREILDIVNGKTTPYKTVET